MKIVLTGSPFSTNHIYFSNPKARTGFRFMGNEARAEKVKYKESAKKQWSTGILKDDVEIEIKLFFKDKRKRDWDNYHKLSMDALTGIVWEDDSQIRKAVVILGIDKENPRTEIEIKELLTDL